MSSLLHNYGFPFLPSLWPGAFALVLGLLAFPREASAAAPKNPDPGQLITVAELEPIVGKITKGPRSVDAPEGGVSSEFNFGKDDWVTLTLYPTSKYNIEEARRILGGPGTVSLPEFGKGAFANPSHAGVAAEFCATKGNHVLNISIPKGDGAVEKLKAIARKALPRL